MAFTYVGDLSTSRDKVRFYLQDIVSGSGPKPSDGNFTDAEIDGLVTAEGSWQRAVAAGFETLASSWMRYPNFRVDDHQVNRTDIAKGYATQAQEWRRKYGASGGGAGSRAVTRIDGYSSDVDNQTV